MHLLVVDDDPVVRTLVSAILSRAGWSIVTAAGGGEALDRLDGDSFDAVLSDVQMPGMNGRELLGRIRANGSTAHLPVILMTGTSDAAVLEALRAEGATASIAKPVDPRTIVEQIRRALQPTN